MDISLETYDALVGARLDAALDPGKWQGFCDKLDAAADGVYVALHAQDLTIGKNAGFYKTRHPEAFARSYQEHYDRLNPILPGLLCAPIGVTIETEEIIDYEELFRSEYYNDWMRPQEDTAAGCGIVLHRSPTRLVTLGCQIRLVDAEAKVQAVKRLLQLLAPHLQRAFEVQRLLEGRALGESLGWQALEALGTPVIFLDRNCRPLHLNAAARALFEERVLLIGAGGGLSLADAGADAFLHAALAAILRNDRAFDLSGRPVRFAKTAAPALLRLLPVPPDPFERFPGPFSIAAPPVAMLTLGMPERDPRSALAGYGLTAAEAALALALAAGGSLAEHAERRAVSIHTVRNQLRAVFQKTGTSRQGELVALLAGVSGAGH